MLLALAHHRHGHLDRAERLYRRVSVHQPEYREALLMLGVTHHEREILNARAQAARAAAAAPTAPAVAVEQPEPQHVQPEPTPAAPAPGPEPMPETIGPAAAAPEPPARPAPERQPEPEAEPTPEPEPAAAHVQPSDVPGGSKPRRKGGQMEWFGDKAEPLPMSLARKGREAARHSAGTRKGARRSGS